MARILIIGLSLVLLSLTTQGQVKTITTYLGRASKRADHLYQQQHYQQAVELYRQALAKDPSNARLKLQLAESFRKLNDPKQAAHWYGQVIHEEVIEAEHQLYYAQALLSSGKLRLAEEWYARYQQALGGDQRAANKLKGIDQMPTFYRDSIMFSVQRMNINSLASDFAPAFYQHGLVFLSARETKQPIKQIFRWNETPYLGMFFSSLDSSGTARGSSPFGGNLASRYHEGPVAFYDHDTRIIFTSNIPGQKNSQQISRLGLFTAQKNKTGRGWTSPTALPFNNSAYSVGHPTLSQDNQTLYFVSDMPGGLGGTDIYSSQLVNGVWQPPTNLGPSINTEGNEVFPFLHANQTLYFASDGREGLGGLDIYRAEIGSQRVENIGYPVNSPSDDFSFILDAAGTRGYFASNRGNQASNDDLYQVAINVHSLDILITDKDSQQPLAGAEVSLIGDGMIEDVALSDQDGLIRFLINPHNTYIINVDKTDYEGNVKIVESESLLATEADQVTKVELARHDGDIDVAVAITNGYTDQPVPHTLVKVVNTEKKDTTYRLTDGDGIIRMKARGHHRYVFSGEFEGTAWSHPEIGAQTLRTKAESKIQIPATSRTVILPVKVADADTRMPLEHVTVRLIEDGKQRAELLTSPRGSTSFNVDPRHNYLLSIEALTHYDDVAIVLAEELRETSQHPVEVFLTKAEKTVSFVTTLYDSTTGAPVANTTVRLRDKDTQEEFTSVSNQRGEVRFKVAPHASYQAAVSTDHEVWAYEETVTIQEDEITTTHWRVPAYQPSSEESLAQNQDSRSITLSVKVIDKESTQPIAQAEVIVISDGAVNDTKTSDREGVVQFKVTEDGNYIIDVSQTEYQGNAIIVDLNQPLNQEAEQQEIVITLQRQTGTVDLTAKLYNPLTDEPIAYTLVQLVNTTTGDTITQATNGQGEISAKADGRSTYRISGKVNEKTWSYPDIDSRLLAHKELNQLIIPIEVPPARIPLRILAKDAVTQQPIEQALVRLIKDGAQQDTSRTTSHGETIFQVNPKESYLVSVEPLAHYDDVAIVMAEELASETEHKVEMWLNSAQGTINVQAQLYDSISKRPLANTIVRIQHEQSGKEVTALSDERGNIQMKVEPGTSYKIAGRITDQVWSFDTNVKAGLQGSELFDVRIPVYKPLSFERLLADTQSEHSSVHSHTFPSQISEEALERATFIVISPFNNAPQPQLWAEIDDQIYRLLSEGAHWYLQQQGNRTSLENNDVRAQDWWQTTGKHTITIRNLFFGSDKFDISVEAAKELDKIASLMKRQPSLRIEASAHTDTRGSSAYNTLLSQKRAQSILQYLVEKGVPRKRIYLNFYGEDHPLQSCPPNGCDEATHQINRRAEFSLHFI